MKTLIKNFLIVFGVLLVITALLSTANFNTVKPEVVGINALIQDINEESVKSIEVKGDYLYATLKDENAAQLEIKKELGQSFSELMSNYGVAPEKLAQVDVTVKDETGWKFWAAVLAPWIVPLLLFGVLIYFFTRQVKGANNKAMGFGQSKAKEAKSDSKDKKTFKDVAGAKEAKEELMEIVEFLKNPKMFLISVHSVFIKYI